MTANLGDDLEIDLEIDLDDLESVPHRIAAACMARPDALCFGLRRAGAWERMSRGELHAAIRRYAEIFRAALPARTLVLFVKHLDAELLAAFIGAMLAGHVPGQISPPSPKVNPNEYARRLRHVLTQTRAGALFADHCPADIAATRTACEHLFVLPGASAFAGDDAALVQFSSGSTGLQKGVVLTHRAILAHSRAYAHALALQRDDVIASWLPLYHDMGLIACYLFPLTCGVPVVQLSPFEWIATPDLLFQAIETFRATITFLPNFAYSVLAKKARRRDLSSMRLFVNCSEPVFEATHAAFAQTFSIAEQRLSVSYAMAENTFVVSQRRPGERYPARSIAGKQVASCGHVVAGTEVTVREAGEDGVGELCVRGEYLFERFLDGSRPLTADGFYPTGDLGIVTPEGEVFVTGRKKDLVIVNGKNIYPQDVETICSAVAGVYPGRAVAFGVDNATVGSEELVVIVERDGSVTDGPMKLAIIERINVELGVVPKQVLVVPHMTLVKTSSGKLCRTRNKELLQAGGVVSRAAK